MPPEETKAGRSHRASDRRPLMIQAQLCCASLLLAVLVINSVSSQELCQGVLRAATSTTSALTRHEVHARSLDSQRIGADREPGCGCKQFNFKRFEIFLNLPNAAGKLPAKHILTEAAELMHSLLYAPPNSSFVDVVGKILLIVFYTLDRKFIVGHQASVNSLIHDARKNILALPHPIGNDLVVAGQHLQIAVLPTYDKLNDSVVILCSKRCNEFVFEEVPRGTQRRFDKCYFALTISNTTLLNVRSAIIAYNINRIVRPVRSIGHRILNSRVVDVVIEQRAGRESAGDQLISMFFKPSKETNTTKGCSYWSKRQVKWTPEGCRMDRMLPNVCHCNLSEHLDEDPHGGQYIVYEYADALFSKKSMLNHLGDALKKSAQSVIDEASTLMHRLTLLPVSKHTLDYVSDILSIATFTGNHAEINKSKMLDLMSDARKCMRTSESGIQSTSCGKCQVFICMYSFPMSECSGTFGAVTFPRSKSEKITPYFTWGLESVNLFSKNNTLAFNVSESVSLSADRIAFITYPLNFTVYPLPETRYPIDSFRMIDLVIESGTPQGSTEDQLLSIFFRPSLTINTTKGCAYWSKTQGNWTAEGCWIYPEISPDVCHCNLSAHLDEDPTGGQYIVYEYSEVIFNKTRLENLRQHTQNMSGQSVLAEASALMHDLTFLPVMRNNLSTVWEILQTAIEVVSKTNNSSSAMLELMDDARNCIPFSEPDYADSAFCGECLKLVVFCKNPDNLDYAAIVFPRSRREATYTYLRSEIEKTNLFSKRYALSLNVSESISLDIDGIAFMAYPLNFNVRSLPSIAYPIYNSRLLDVVIEPSTKRKPARDQLISVFFKPSSTVNTTKGCAYWSEAQGKWSPEGCWVDLQISPDVCQCNLSAHIDEDPTGGQYIVYEYSDVLFNDTMLLSLKAHALNMTAQSVIDQATALMRNLTLLPLTKDTLGNVWEILEIIVTNDDYNTDNNSAMLLQLMADARKCMRPLEQLVKYNYITLCGECLNIFTFQYFTTKILDSVASAAFPRKRREKVTLVNSGRELEAVNLFSDNYTLALNVSPSLSLYAYGITFITYPLDFNIHPLPSIGYQIYSLRTMDVIIEPSTRPVESTEDVLISIIFKPSLTVGVNTTKGCAFWSEIRGEWTTKGCWVDVSRPDVCHCNLATHLDEDPTGGKYIVYEYSDILFNDTSYEYLIKQQCPESTEYSFSEESELMRNLSFLPAGHRFKITRLLGLVSSALMVKSHCQYYFAPTDESAEHIKSLYEDTRNILCTDFEWTHSQRVHREHGITLLFNTFEDHESNPYLYVYSYFKKYVNVEVAQEESLSTFHDVVVTYGLSISHSVAEQNERVIYMVYPMDQFLFSEPDAKSLDLSFDNVQVHNYRVVDIILVPRAGVESEEHQFIDIWYKPSVSKVVPLDLHVGCAYWSGRDSAWTAEGCIVQANATSRGCKCNLSAHFNERRDGGQYAVFEYSDVILDYKRIDCLIYCTCSEECNIQEVDKLFDFVHNATKIGYISQKDMLWIGDIVMNVLTYGDSALKGVDNLPALEEDMHATVYRWACDSTLNAAILDLRHNASIISSSQVAIEASEVLSNKVVRAKTPLLNQLFIFALRLGFLESDIGVKITSNKETVLSKVNLNDTSVQSQFLFYFTVDSADKVLFALVLYPESKMFLPLPQTLPAILSYHVLEVTIISEDPGATLQPMPTFNRLVTLVHVPVNRPFAAAATECAVWTGADWSTETCWPETSNEHACTCNLSRHALSNGSFLPLIIFESLEAANFSPKTSLSGLNILYVVSSSISLIGLVLIAVTAIVFPQWRADVGHKIMLHLSLALFLYQLLRLFRETHHVYTALNRNVAAFVAFTAFTHYSRLAHYAWMLTMSLLQLRRLLTVVGAVDTSHLLLKVSVLAWGVPLVPLVTLLAWDCEAHFSRSSLTTHLVLYLVPGAAVNLVNGTLLMIIIARVFSCFGWGQVANLERHGLSGAKLTGRRLASSVLLFFLFGIPTTFEMANDFWGHSLTLEVLFKLFDPVRGAVVFLFFIVLDRKTCDMWRQMLRSFTVNSLQYFEMW